jgi:glycosyltransferase involved in cell wall biosynthesis
MASLRTLYYWPAHKLYDAAFASDERANLLNASMVLTNSRFTRGLLADRYGVDAQVVYPGIDTDTFRPTSRRIGHYVLCVGALIYGKGYRFLISAIGRIPPTRRPMLFIVADSLDPTEAVEVQRMAAVAGVGLRIERIQNDAHLANVYTEAAAFVYAPIAEPLGLAPLEAMACGTPVVAVRDGGVCETVRDGETGWLVERDPSEFAERLDRLLCNRAERTRMSRAGVEYVRREWTWSSAVARLEDAFQAVAG